MKPETLTSGVNADQLRYHSKKKISRKCRPLADTIFERRKFLTYVSSSTVA